MTDRWGDLSLWPAKPEVSPLRDEHEHEWEIDGLTAEMIGTDLLADHCLTCGAPRHAVARSTDPGTSWEAARSITPDSRTAAQKAVLYALRKWGPCTDEALLAHFMGVSPSGIRTRRSELVAMGLVRDSGRKDVLRSGRRAIVWEAV